MAGGGSASLQQPEEELTPAANKTQPPKEVLSNYTKLGEHFRMVAPPELQCSVFCGGRRCRYDTYENWLPEDMAIDGIFSHWITPEILAMARPNADVMETKGVVQQFLDNGIKTLINLQQVGEHASCGAPLLQGGFSYDPNTFMEKGIFYYNFQLRDHSEPSIKNLLDMIKVMAFSVTEGKVAVHCHAGLGRTGVLISCYLVYYLRVHANDAVRYVRHKRSNSVQTRNQILLVQEFEAYILPELYVFCNREFLKERNNAEFTLQTYMSRQRSVLHGYESRALRYIPKLIYIICERLLRLCGTGPAPPHMLAPLDINYSLTSPAFTSFFISAQFEREAGRVSYSAPLSIGSPSLSSMSNNSDSGSKAVGSSAKLRKTTNSSESSNLSEDGSREDTFDEGHVSMPSSAIYPNRMRDNGNHSDIPSCLSGYPNQSIDALLNDGINNERLADNKCFQELSSSTDLKKLAEEGIQTVDASDIYEALVQDHSVLGPEYLKKLRNYRHELNIRQSSWDRLAAETDTTILTGLLYSWLEHLKTPMWTVNDLSYLVLAAHKPEVVLRKMDRDLRYTVEYMIRFIARLQPLVPNQQKDLIRRFIASITHQAVPVNNTLLPTGRSFKKLRDGTMNKCIEFMSKLFQLVYLDTSRPHTILGTPPTQKRRSVEGVSPPGRVDSPILDESAEINGQFEGNEVGYRDRGTN